MFSKRLTIIFIALKRNNMLRIVETAVSANMTYKTQLKLSNGKL
jgi:hypothetical protein